MCPLGFGRPNTRGAEGLARRCLTARYTEHTIRSVHDRCGALDRHGAHPRGAHEHQCTLARRAADCVGFRGDRARHGRRRPSADRGHAPPAGRLRAGDRLHGRPRPHDRRPDHRGRRRGARRVARARPGERRGHQAQVRLVRPRDAALEREAGGFPRGRAHPREPGRHRAGLRGRARRGALLLRAGRAARDAAAVSRPRCAGGRRARAPQHVPDSPAHVRARRVRGRREARWPRGGGAGDRHRLSRELSRDRSEGPRARRDRRRGRGARPWAT